MTAVGDLRRWQPGALESAADDVTAARRRLERSADALDDTARAVARSWHGAAGEAAGRAARLRARRAAALVTATAGVGRGMAVGADGLAGAIAALERASRLAAEHGLRITDTGAVVPAAGAAGGRGGASPDVAADAGGAAAQVRAMVHAAVAAAGTADGEAAHLVRAALRAADTDPTSGGGLGASVGAALWRRGGRLVGAPRVPPAGTAPADVTRWWAALPVADRTRLLTEHPERLGNLDGVPLHVRALANRSVIVETLAQERRLAERLATRAGEPGGLAAAALLAACRRRIARYEDLIAEPTTVGWEASGAPVTAPGHQVVLFDPAGGRFAEVAGTLGPATTSVGILLGGTGTDAGNMAGQYDRAMSFVSAARPHGSLAVITYLGGDMPQDLDGAASNHAARVVGPRLVDFAAGVDRPDGATLTVVGHSYGGSVVGAAEVAGLDVDRVVHVESAGAGPDVRGVGDYAHPGVERFSMTAPGDPIALVQGQQLGGIGHGADPDLLHGVTRLETGYMRAGDPSSGRIDGPWSHSGVFTEGSTAWRNILDAMTGAPVLAEGAVP